jgi:hypothetical protein
MRIQNECLAENHIEFNIKYILKGELHEVHEQPDYLA